jgi:dihydroxy-acid dehydratase
LGVVRDGDVVVCDVEERALSLEVDEGEIQERIERRRREMAGKGDEPWVAREGARGYHGLYMREVNQAEHGVDFGFLIADGPRAAIKGAETASA